MTQYIEETRTQPHLELHAIPEIGQAIRLVRRGHSSDYAVLTDAEWAYFYPLFEHHKKNRGKPHVAWRSLLNSIFFVLTLQTKWGTWPDTADFASRSSAHRWFLRWKKNGFLTKLIEIMKSIHPEFPDALPDERIHIMPTAQF